MLFVFPSQCSTHLGMPEQLPAPWEDVNEFLVCLCEAFTLPIKLSISTKGCSHFSNPLSHPHLASPHWQGGMSEHLSVAETGLKLNHDKHYLSSYHYTH